MESQVSCEKKYHFTTEWFEYQKQFIVQFISKPDTEYQILEIGAFEGRSTTFLIDNYLSHPNSSIESIDPFVLADKTTPLTDSTYTIFLKNITNSKYPNKHRLYKAYSQQILPLLLVERKKYDLITIDGSHLTPDVLFDAVNSFHLLKNGGYMFFDDYGACDPKLAIDAFLTCFKDKLSTIHIGYHLIVKKIAD